MALEFLLAPSMRSVCRNEVQRDKVQHQQISGKRLPAMSEVPPLAASRLHRIEPIVFQAPVGTAAGDDLGHIAPVDRQVGDEGGVELPHSGVGIGDVTRDPRQPAMGVGVEACPVLGNVPLMCENGQVLRAEDRECGHCNVLHGTGDILASAQIRNACATVPQCLELIQAPFHGVAGITAVLNSSPQWQAILTWCNSESFRGHRA